MGKICTILRYQNMYETNMRFNDTYENWKEEKQTFNLLEKLHLALMYIFILPSFCFAFFLNKMWRVSSKLWYWKLISRVQNRFFHIEFRAVIRKKGKTITLNEERRERHCTVCGTANQNKLYAARHKHKIAEWKSNGRHVKRFSEFVCKFYLFIYFSFSFFSWRSQTKGNKENWIMESHC